MTIDKVFKIGVLFLGFCIAAVLAFSSFAGKRYEFIRASNLMGVFDHKSGQFYVSNDLKNVAMLDLINGKRTFKPLAFASTNPNTKDYYSKEVQKDSFEDIPTKESSTENHPSGTAQKGFFDDLIPSKNPPSK